jgi:DNA-binding transcriptional MerR regulator
MTEVSPPSRGSTQRRFTESGRRDRPRPAPPPRDQAGPSRASGGSDDLTIEELAGRVGLSVRNIRSHHHRGLIPPPTIRRRVGYYGPEHVARLRLITEMQQEGFSLRVIKRLLERADGSVAELLRFRQAVRRPLQEESPEVVAGSELAARWGTDVSQRQLERFVHLDLLRPLEGGRVEIVSPRLERMGVQLLAIGVDVDEMLDAVAEVKRHTRAIAERYVQLFVESVCAPAAQAPAGPGQWERMREALEAMRPLAAESLVAMFAREMHAASERALELLAAERVERPGSAERDDRPASKGRIQRPGREGRTR